MLVNLFLKVNAALVGIFDIVGEDKSYNSYYYRLYYYIPWTLTFILYYRAMGNICPNLCHRQKYIEEIMEEEIDF